MNRKGSTMNSYKLASFLHEKAIFPKFRTYKVQLVIRKICGLNSLKPSVNFATKTLNSTPVKMEN